MRGGQGSSQLNTVHARQGYTLPLKFDVDTAAQFASNFVLPCGSRAYLQTDC